MTNSSTSPDRLLAKSAPPIELPKHCTAVAEEATTIIDSSAVERVLESPLVDADIDLETVISLTRAAGRLHDTGKAHPEWQAAIREGDDSDTVRLPPHSGRSALYTFACLRAGDVLPVSSRLEGMAVVLAILHHHTPLTVEHMAVDQRDPASVLGYDHDTRETMPQTLADAGFPSVEIPPEILEYLITELTAVRKGLGRGSGDTGYDSATLGVLTTLIRAALIQADHYVSATETGTTAARPVSLDPEELQLYSTLRPFQQQIVEALESPLIGIAGCGEGKTHSAVQWGQRMLQEGQADRLIFAMPTRVTTNNLLLSLTGGDEGNDLAHIPPEKAGLYHSAGSVFYKGEVAAERWDTSAEMLSERARRWFQTPVTVTTVDHVLSTLVNGYRGATIARGNLLRSAIIFDELHAYETRLTGHILGALEQLQTLGIPWYVMTATLPPAVRHDHALTPAKTVESMGKLSTDQPPREPFKVRLNRQRLTADTVHDVLSDSSMAPRRLMVVKNTVRGARDLALSLRKRGHDVTYYSSEFIREHRRRKEEEIRSTFSSETYTSDEPQRILVCTQVCEISLDLSADLLLTDVAPMDAILQRAGRLHRQGTTPTTSSCECRQCASRDDQTYECRVFAPLAGRDRWYPYAPPGDEDAWQLLIQTTEVCDEADTYRFDRSIEWVEQAYNGLNPDYRRYPIQNAMREDRLFGPHRRVTGESDEGDDHLQWRAFNTYRREVLASRYTGPDGKTWTPAERWALEHDCHKTVCGVHAEGVNKCTEAWQEFRRRYEVGIPRWWLSSDEIPVGAPKPLHDDYGPIQGSEVAAVDYAYSSGVTPMD